MLVGELIEDYYTDLKKFPEPKPIPSNYRFYNTDEKPIKILNDLQEQNN